MIHPDTELRPAGRGIGYGVFAIRMIPEGTITWVQDALDRVFPPAVKESFPPVYQPLLEKYTFRDEAGSFVLCWDIARFMNHRCEPSCLGTRFGFEVAIRDIVPDEELTVDYATLHLLPQEAFECLCDAPGCREWIEAGDAERLAPDWAEAFARVLPRTAEMPQPLLPIVGEERLRSAFEALGLGYPAAAGWGPSDQGA